MRLRVVHETRYSYNSPVHAMAMEARLQPCSDDYQTCLRYRLQVTPRAPIYEYTTYNEVNVHYWSLLKANEVIVLSESLVETGARPLNPIEVPPLALEDRGEVQNFPYLQQTPLTIVTNDVLDYAEQFRQLAQEDWYQTALAVRRSTYEAIGFQVGCTHVQTTASEVLRGGCGVCQDYTHLMIATMRALGIPTRYVSGYLSQDLEHSPALNAGGIMYQSMSQNNVQQWFDEFSPDLRGERSVQGTGASHAWCEVYFGPEVGWRGFDPTNDLFVDQYYVRIGCGRDFNDLTPIRGVHKGPAEEQLQVIVSVKAAA